MLKKDTDDENAREFLYEESFGAGLMALTLCTYLKQMHRPTTSTAQHALITFCSVHAKQTAIHTHTHPFNGPLSGTTRVSQYQKGKTNLDFTEARDSEWQWHHLGQMQVCTSFQITDNHASTPHSVFYRPDALPAAQPTASKHWRTKTNSNNANKS